MAKKENEIAEVKANAVATLDLNDDIESYLETHDVRDIDPSEVITPRINILQSMSKQVKKTDPEYIKGAEEGFIFNSLTKELVDGGDGITFVPCYSETVYNEWIPTSLGGGLKKRWGTDTSFKNHAVEEKGKFQFLSTDEKGKQYVASEVSKTADYYVLIVDKNTGTFSYAVIGFSGTKYKIHRKLINDISLPDYTKKDGSVTTPPPFYRVYDLFTVPESDGTNSWFNYKFVRSGNITSLPNAKTIMEAAKNFRELVIEGKIVAESEQQEVKLEDDNTTI